MDQRAVVMRLRCKPVRETVNNPGPNDPAPELWPGKWGERVELTAVYDSDRTSPNYSFSTATPSADLSATISNPSAWGFFREGVEYDVLFTPRATIRPR